MEDYKWINNIGKELKKERLSWAMSRTKLAKLSYVDRDTIIEIEQGIIKNPNYFDVLKICDVLETSIFYFMEKVIK